MTEAYRIKNWDNFQHYHKNAGPPKWIKLHWDLLTSDDWVMLRDSDKLLMVVCMMVASKRGGDIPANPVYIQRVAYLEQVPDLQPLVDCGFLVPIAKTETPLPISRSSLEQVYSDSLADKSRVEEIRVEERRGDSCAEPEAASTPPAVFAVLPLIKRDGEHAVTLDKIAEWKDAYPGVDVESEVKRAIQWCKDNPTLRKTKTGANTFFNKWLTKEQNRAALHRGSECGDAKKPRQKPEWQLKMEAAGKEVW